MFDYTVVSINIIMEKIKRMMRRGALLLLIIIAAMIPAPIFFQKKEGKFNQDNIIELVEKSEDKVEEEAFEMKQEIKS